MHQIASLQEWMVYFPMESYIYRLWNCSKHVIGRATAVARSPHTFPAFLVLCPALLILQCWRASLATSEMNFWAARDINRTLEGGRVRGRQGGREAGRQGDRQREREREEGGRRKRGREGGGESVR